MQDNLERFLGKGLPQRPLAGLPGRLFTIEGTDFSGRRTQLNRLAGWLEAAGYAVMIDEPEDEGIVSSVVREGEAEGVGRYTLGLLHATELADSLETRIIPAMLAGFCVLTDRYVYSRMAMDMVNGLELEWLEQLYGFALRPDLAICLQVHPRYALRRALLEEGRLNLDYRQLAAKNASSPDRVAAFTRYQERLARAFSLLAPRYDLVTIDGNRTPENVGKIIEGEIRRIPALVTA